MVLVPGVRVQTQVITSTSDLDEVGWDTLAHPSFYLSAAWLKARSRTLNAAPRFILVSREDGVPLVGMPAYLVDGRSHPGYDPARVLAVDDLTDAEVAAWPEGVPALAGLRSSLRERAAEWMPSMVVSAPARYGGVSYARDLSDETARTALGSALDAVGKQAVEDGARSTCWLYLVEDEDPLLASALADRGYLSVAVDAECYLPIGWNTFDGYLRSLAPVRRRKCQSEMRKFDAAGVRVEMRGGEALGPELAELELQWRMKYGRTPPMEEILAGYEELRSYFPDTLRIFVATLDGRPVGFSLFHDSGNTWYSRFGGFDYSAGNIFLYYNLLFYRPIAVAIERGVSNIRYSLKSYAAKCSRGCTLRNVLAYVQPPAGPSSLPASLDLVDRAQRRRFGVFKDRHERLAQS
jgi:predicted N-acyltransferase